MKIAEREMSLESIMVKTTGTIRFFLERLAVGEMRKR